MCLVTSSERDYYVKKEGDGEYYAPRPVSNYHGGSKSSSSGGGTSRRTSVIVPSGRRSNYSYRSRSSTYSSGSPPSSSRRRVSREVFYRGEDGVYYRNLGHSHSIRSSKTGGSDSKSSGKHHFSISSLRGVGQPELSKKLRTLIKSQNHAISAYETAGKESQSIASQLSEWGESTEDDAVSDISDKLGVLLAEVAEQEDLFAQNLEDSRGVLKQIRNTEASVAPTRTAKQKIQDEIQKLKYKEPESTKLVTLEQELVRAEAQCLVADAQLTNVTRQKFKEAYDVHTAAIIERAEKQIMLATQARHLINLLDDTPIVPGEERVAFANAEVAREVLNDAESGLRHWTSSVQPITSSSGKIGQNAMATNTEMATRAPENEHLSNEQRIEALERAQEEAGIATTSPPYPTEKTEETAIPA